MRTVHEVFLTVAGAVEEGNPDGEHMLREYVKEVVNEAIDRIRNQPTNNPERGEDDYRPGKYMAIGMLYEFKDQIK